MWVVPKPDQQGELRRLLAETGAHRLVIAQLVYHQDPGDADVVAVHVGGYQVGYIGRRDLHHDGRELRKALSRLAERSIAATSWAEITEGTDEEPSIHARLLTSGFDAPDKPYAFPLTLPPGSFVQVLGTEGHAGILLELLGGADERSTECSTEDRCHRPHGRRDWGTTAARRAGRDDDRHDLCRGLSPPPAPASATRRGRPAGLRLGSTP
jgi:hypothetical protein